MFSNFVAALMDDDDLVYVLYVFRGHLFRKYPDGRLGRVVAPGPFVVLAFVVGPVALLLGAWFDSSRRSPAFCGFSWGF